MRQLSRATPKDSLWDFMVDMDRALDGFWDTPAITQAGEMRTTTFTPAADIHETDDSYLISLDVPGMNESDIKIDVQDNRLTLSGERQAEKSENEKSFRRFERSYGKFERTFQLPAETDAQGINAALENGVLEVLIPKKEVSKPRKVEIQAKKGGLFSRLIGKDAVKNEEPH